MPNPGQSSFTALCLFPNLQKEGNITELHCLAPRVILRILRMDCSAECFTPRRRSLSICKPGPSTLSSHTALGTGRRGEAIRTHKTCLVYLQQSHEPPSSDSPPLPSWLLLLALSPFSPSPLTLSSHTHPVPGPPILSGNSDLSSTALYDGFRCTHHKTPV